MNAVGRWLTWTRFVLSEYMRSGRILIELTLTIAFWTLFFQSSAARNTMTHLFSLTGLFGIGLALYTTSSMLGLGDRPQNYILLTRPLGRRGFLLGLYAAAVLLVWAMVVVVLGLASLINRPLDFTAAKLFYGLLPVLLNVGLLCALMLLLSSLVVKNVARLLLLAVLALALYTNTWNLSPVYRYLSPLQAIFSRLVEPAIAGQRLAVSRDYTQGGAAILVAQFALTLVLVSLALLSFRKRELILGKR